MKKSKKKISKIKVVLVLMILCIVPLFVQRSLCATTTVQTKISTAIDNYFNSIKNSTHQMTVSVTHEEFYNRIREIKSYKSVMDGQANVENINQAYTNLQNIYGTGSAKATMVASYIKIKRETDDLFQLLNSQSDSNLKVKYDGQTEYTYFKYDITEAPPANNYSTSFLSLARATKTRIERLILVYAVENDAKYLAALKKEILTAAQWENNWQSSQYIDAAEIAYAVSLGYDYAYNLLSADQRCIIENRLLLAVLLYGTTNCSAAIKKSTGNFNEVGHSGVGIAALTLIKSSNQGTIKVVSIDDKGIMIKYPVKSINSDGSIKYTYSDILINGNGGAKITNPELVNLLNSKMQSNSSGKYIPLRALYSSIVILHYC